MIGDCIITDKQRSVTLAYLERFRDEARLLSLACFARCCILLTEPNSQSIQQAGQEAEAMAKTVQDHRDPDSLQLDPLLLVAHFNMLAQAGCATPRLRELVQLIANEMTDLPEDVRSSGRTGHLARLLARNGVATWSGRTNAGPDLLGDDVLLLQSSDAIQELIERLSASSIPLTKTTVEILSLIALSELRDYRLDCGIGILRFLIETGWDNDYMDEAVRFVALQRTVAGTYGFFNPLVDNGLDAEEQDRGLHLPNTLNAVWLIKLVADHARSVETSPPQSAVAM